MIAITISLIILAALSYVFINNSQSTSAIERANQQIENGRYAMQTLNDDLQMAGYWAEFRIGAAIKAGRIATPATLPDPCTDASSAANLQALAASMPLAIQGYDQSATLSCLTNVAPNTDILVVRRVSGCVAGSSADCAVQAGAPYFQASLCNNSAELNSTSITDQYRLDTNTTNLNRTQRDCSTAAVWHQYLTHIYYVANDDQAGDGIPTLKRMELGANGWTTVSIAQGVQDLQIDYGIDTDGDHVPDVYEADPVNYTYATPAPGCSAAPCVSNFQNTMALQIYLLVRNPSATAGYKDAKAYNLGLDAAGNPYVDGPFNDSYKRHVYSSAVRLINPSIRE